MTKKSLPVPPRTSVPVSGVGNAGNTVTVQGSNRSSSKALIRNYSKKTNRMAEFRRIWVALIPLKLSLLLAFFFLSSIFSREKYSLPQEHSCYDKEAPSALPKPLILYVAGSGRTGTTYMYNLVRIMLRQRDPNTIFGWYEDLSVTAARYSSPTQPSSPILDNNNHVSGDIDAWHGALDAYRSTGTSVLVKVHSLAHGIRLFSGCDNKANREIQSAECPVDAVFQTHRDIGPQLASIRRMGWARHLDKAELEDPAEFCRKQKHKFRRVQPRLSHDDWKDPEIWKQQATAIMACSREWYHATGNKLVLDMAMESLSAYEQRLQLARSIKEEIINLDPSSFSNDIDPESAVKEADKLRPLSCSSWQAVNPITHFHRGHLFDPTANNNTAAEERRIEAQGVGLLQEDPLIKKWRNDFNYA